MLRIGDLGRGRATLMVVTVAFSLLGSPAALAERTAGRAWPGAQGSQRNEGRGAAASQEHRAGRSRGDEMSAPGRATASSSKHAGRSRGDEMSARATEKASGDGATARARGKAHKNEFEAEDAFRSGAPGNNGTLKVDGVVFDDGRDNEPHPGCTFRLKFFGYDEGPDIFATVTFALQAPTGDETLTTDRVFIGDGDAASSTYDLSSALTGVAAHPQQGHHVKLTVESPYSNGAEVKHKVFWVECTPSGFSQAEALGAKQLSVDPLPSASVLGRRLTARPYEGSHNSHNSHHSHNSHSHNSHDGHELAQRRPTGPRLPFTGASLATLLAVALALMGGGALALRARRR